MPNPYILLLVAILLAGAYVAGRHDGAKINEAAWQKREAEINGKQADLIAKANQAVREEEHAKAQKFVEISTTLQGKIKEKDRALQIALDSVKSGTGRLFVTASCPAPSGDAKGSVTAGASRNNDATRAYLPTETSETLLRIGAEADSVVLQLLSCQDILRADRK